MTEPGFVVGGQYANAAGEYTVVALEDGSARVRYGSGIELTLPAGGLWAQWEKIIEERTGRPAAPPAAARKTASHRPPREPAARASSSKRAPSASKPRKATGEAGFYTAAGYLATGCDITASVAGRDYPAFAQRYKILTGRTLIAPHDGLDIHERPTHRIGAELSVRFPASATLLSRFELPDGATAEATDQPGTYAIHRTEFVERLLKLGFDLGRHTDPLTIRERVPEAQQGAFDHGLSLRRGLRL